MEKERIQKILSNLGVCSRRKAEEFIKEGRVSVNGTVVSEMGFKCSDDDVIEVDGKKVSGDKPEKKIYLAFNKPYDVVSTLSDPEGRKTIADFIPKSYGRLFPVGRLDHNSTGLMIMTNDGEFANLVTHPSSAPEKEYLVKVKNKLDGTEVSKFAKGVYVMQDGYTALPCKATVLREDEDGAIFSIILREGKKRQIRHMMESLYHPVRMLVRIRIGNILLGKLSEGKFEEIDEETINDLLLQCKHDKEHNNFMKEDGNGQDFEE